MCSSDLVIVMGSLGVAHHLMREDLVDEYRLLIFPTVLGAGRRLFDAPGARSGNLTLTSVAQSGAAALLYFEKAGQ